MTDKDIEKLLNAPFKANEIEWRVGATNKDKTKGIALPYVTNRAIQKRLDEVFGIFGWKNEYREWKGTKQLCGISVFHNGEWITKWDGADDSNMDATKGGLSGAMKRCACQWGIGRYLYDIPTQWTKIVPNGKSYKIATKPSLPDWALSQGQTVSKKVWKAEELPNVAEIPANIQKVIDSFERFDVKQGDLENYLNNEAHCFSDQDIEDLRYVYGELLKGKSKDDFFHKDEPSKVGRRGKELNNALTHKKVE